MESVQCYKLEWFTGCTSVRKFYKKDREWEKGNKCVTSEKIVSVCSIFGSYTCWGMNTCIGYKVQCSQTRSAMRHFLKRTSTICKAYASKHHGSMVHIFVKLLRNQESLSHTESGGNLPAECTPHDRLRLAGVECPRYPLSTITQTPLFTYGMPKMCVWHTGG